MAVLLYAENEEPQAHELVAFGFSNLKPEPFRLSTKSTVTPLSSGAEKGSTSSLTEPHSTTTSSSAACSSRLMPYWNPEQPPPEMAMRRPATGPAAPWMNFS